MNGEVERYRPRSVARQHGRELDAVRREMDLAGARMAAAGYLTRQAVGQHLLASLMVEEAMQQAPSGSREYRFLAVSGAIEMAAEIGRFKGGR